jgi:hypothetical protein
MMVRFPHPERDHIMKKGAIREIPVLGPMALSEDTELMLSFLGDIPENLQAQTAHWLNHLASFRDQDAYHSKTCLSACHNIGILSEDLKILVELYVIEDFGPSLSHLALANQWTQWLIPRLQKKIMATSRC